MMTRGPYRARGVELRASLGACVRECADSTTRGPRRATDVTWMRSMIRSRSIDIHRDRCRDRSIAIDSRSRPDVVAIDRAIAWGCPVGVRVPGHDRSMSTTHTKGERPPQKKAPPSVGWGNLAEISSVDRDPSGSRAIDVAHRWMTRAIDACAGWTTTTTHACAKRAIDSRACWRGRRRRARRRGRRRAGLRRVSLARVARARTVRDGARA